MSSPLLSVVAVGVALLALALALALAVRLGRLSRAYDSLVAGEHSSSFVTAMGRQSAAARRLRSEVASLRDEVVASRGSSAGVLRHVAVVRYDAFGDLAGALSFSAALLDDNGDGLVLSSINGRSETRTYCKGISGRSSESPLSPEEQEAIAAAGRSLVPAVRAVG